MKGKTREERLKNWYDHFQALLGGIPEEEEEIEPVCDEQDIDDGPFSK